MAKSSSAHQILSRSIADNSLSAGCFLNAQTRGAAYLEAIDFKPSVEVAPGTVFHDRGPYLICE